MTAVIRSDQRADVERDRRGLRIVLPSVATSGVLAVVDCDIPDGVLAGPA